MHLTKAIELLQHDLDDPGSVDISDLDAAQELAIEALTFILRDRQSSIYRQFNRLPGETE